MSLQRQKLWLQTLVAWQLNLLNTIVVELSKSQIDISVQYSICIIHTNHILYLLCQKCLSKFYSHFVKGISTQYWEWKLHNYLLWPWLINESPATDLDVLMGAILSTTVAAAILEFYVQLLSINSVTQTFGNNLLIEEFMKWNHVAWHTDTVHWVNSIGM